MYRKPTSLVWLGWRSRLEVQLEHSRKTHPKSKTAVFRRYDAARTQVLGSVQINKQRVISQEAYTKPRRATVRVRTRLTKKYRGSAKKFSGAGLNCIEDTGAGCGKWKRSNAAAEWRGETTPRAVHVIM